MRFATLEVDGRPAVVVISEDGQQWADVRASVLGFDGDLVDLIATMPAGVKDFPAVTWQPLSGHRLLAPIPRVRSPAWTSRPRRTSRRRRCR